MTTSPAIPALGSNEPWRSEDHWKAGDKAWWISLTGDGVSMTMVDIADPVEGTVRDPRVTYNDGVFRLADRFESVRHREGSCTSCADSVSNYSPLVKTRKPPTGEDGLPRYTPDSTR
ncbi:hypothetical protein MTX37_29140 [Rhodococcus sp. ARC_M8]|uniref:hypothetical protein n=1 Tax=Rhodococcus sp. ARC_M8 TaxID=2928853 RepID=UPI001FB2799B|nr:hypothetical protein [Rhodococcus sp. ARC_M8]MCJ0949992.1 hypothetical protein [Rhodococcus sp. ARC_M8]